MYNHLLIEDIIKNALIEDMNYGDITTDALVDGDKTGIAIITAKEEGVIAGTSIVEMVFKLVDQTLYVTNLKQDGEKVNTGDNMIEVDGNIKSILKGERIALNFMQRMSGIATTAREFADRVEGFNTKIVDTRKTTPGLRSLEKYAVKVGGCYNHRFNLSDAVLIKDNHIKAVGGITEAVKRCRVQIPHTAKIEVEVESLEQLEEAIEVKADIIMLDNMTVEMMKEAVQRTKGRALLEASGNMTKEKIKEVAATGVDFISVGLLTHSVKAMDISLNIQMK
ncbi:nicotinate-nucleotide pyrophosphorylase [Alkaliphilus metalliredigens QYMF]|uniref:Probable nicotinate-nucleotide pyrophosphorylase [carboxylating] n=1 Tax=Alkaliphilus metalliredigens (strain QYMF) TaxID=293826 RepID=A6TJ94_ALKMQ|nr:carboxylating nicotinate-nucleotide diphosphorylase [Alkaliphilus metalliredigens]ABR46262.1 nicotinate-nucleotide pyrophosphorylase [Alkaliphilus metalliredigens QYMF]